jgi:glyoxylase-like metal-dependent hydrolase (beta-lactamase superfamily II)
VVWVPELKLLFAGGLAIPHLAPGQLATADLAAWKFSLERLKSYPAEVVIPAEPGTEESGFGPDLLTHSLEAVTRALAPPPVPGEIQKGSP